LAVMNIAKKAEETVSVVMLKDGAYKNQLISEDMLIEYPMQRLEFEKYSVVQNNGVKEMRLVPWNERKMLLGAYAAMNIKAEFLVEWGNFVIERVDNSDTVLYSYPGKEIIKLDIAKSDMNAFKTFLKPGSKLNIDAIYSEEVEIEKEDAYGNLTKETLEVYRRERVFGNIEIADMTNSSGQSVLDIYADYNERTIQQQAILDASSSFQNSVTPSDLLVALTPEEKDIYYKFCAKNNIEFRMSLPQATN